jgi:hypothetical protein
MDYARILKAATPLAFLFDGSSTQCDASLAIE